MKTRNQAEQPTREEVVAALAEHFNANPATLTDDTLISDLWRASGNIFTWGLLWLTMEENFNLEFCDEKRFPGCGDMRVHKRRLESKLTTVGRIVAVVRACWRQNNK